MKPLFFANEKFSPLAGEKWVKYCEWAKIPLLTEVVSLDCLLCPRILLEIQDAHWPHIVNEDFPLSYFSNLDYLLKGVAHAPSRNILGLYRNPVAQIETKPAAGQFVFLGYDLIEEGTKISALTNCGGFPDVFGNHELNQFGLITGFARAHEVQQQLAARYPKKPHAQCERYAIWRLEESGGDN